MVKVGGCSERNMENCGDVVREREKWGRGPWCGDRWIYIPRRREIMVYLGRSDDIVLGHETRRPSKNLF